MFFAMVPKTFLDQMLALKSNQATGKLEPDAARNVSHSTQWRAKSFLPSAYMSKDMSNLHEFIMSHSCQRRLFRPSDTPSSVRHERMRGGEYGRAGFCLPHLGPRSLDWA